MAQLQTDVGTIITDVGGGGGVIVTTGVSGSGDTIPTETYLRLRFANTTWSGTPTEQINVALVKLTTATPNISYRWMGFFNFEAASYNFSVTATNGIRVTVGGDRIIDDVVLAPSRTVSATKMMAAGTALVMIEWTNPSGTGNILFDFTPAVTGQWQSCVDGQLHDGAPPSDWLFDVHGNCWSPPPTDSGSANTDLTKIVVVAPETGTPIERTYILNSGVAQQPQQFRLFNCATNMSVNVEMTGPPEVKFLTAFQFVGDVGVGGLPADKFELQPRREMLVDMVFDPAKLNALPEGLNQSSIMVRLSAGTITVPPGGDAQVQVGICDSITIPGQPTSSQPPATTGSQPPTPTWLDCSSGTAVVQSGTPPTGWIMRSDGCFIPPPAPPPVITMDFTFQQLPNINSNLRGILTAQLQGDDPTTYAYQWNFDVNRQGAGAGLIAANPTTVSWKLTLTDISSIITSGRTTRTVEVIATKGTQVFRARKVITFINLTDTSTTTGGATGGGGTGDNTLKLF